MSERMPKDPGKILPNPGFADWVVNDALLKVHDGVEMLLSHINSEHPEIQQIAVTLLVALADTYLANGQNVRAKQLYDEAYRLAPLVVLDRVNAVLAMLEAVDSQDQQSQFELAALLRCKARLLGQLHIADEGLRRDHQQVVTALIHRAGSIVARLHMPA